MTTTGTRRQCDATAGGRCEAAAAHHSGNYMGEGGSKYLCSDHLSASLYAFDFSPLTDDVVLSVALCSARRSVRIVFTGPEASANAIAYIERTDWSDRAMDVESAPTTEVEDWADAKWGLTASCVHGLSAWLCEGPGHYPADR